MDENAMIFVRPQVLGWQQCDMVSVQSAAENGSDKELQEAVSEAIDNLTWGGLRLHSFGSLPYHYELELAARVRQATSVVMPAAKEGQPDIWGEGGAQFVWRFVNPAVCHREVMYARERRQPALHFVVAMMKDRGVYRPISANLH
jgi:hypothetical protein